jgi:hypothetical protein
MKTLTLIATLIVGFTGLTACSTLSQTPVYTAQFGDSLLAAGFAVKVATTPAQVAMLARLPQHRFVSRFKGDTVRYAFADSTLCGCLYLGDQNAMNQLRANRIAQQIYDQQLLAAVAFQDALWDWGAWGSWGESYNFTFGPGW